MSLSIDKDLGEQGENARAVLASWLDDYISGRCDRADMQAQFLSVCRSNPDAPWDALALLDQYQRRGRIDVALARSLKTDIAQLVFGVATQTETKDETPRADFTTTDVTIDTTGSRWRSLLAEREPASINSEPAFVDPTLFRREQEAPTRPPPSLKLDEEEPAPRDPKDVSPAEVRQQGAARERSSRAASSANVGLSSDILRDRYELIAILGRGSTGTVYKAIDRHRAHLEPASRCVAVKVLKLNYQDRPDELAQLEREFHQAQSLSHPNVVSVFDLDRDGNVYFIVMELLEGELLADILNRLDGKPMARHFALGIINSVGAALAHAHRRDIVHADIKPRNIMITTSGDVRVLDFGFARDRPLDLHTAPGTHDVPIAAPAYASVERVNGSEPHPSDDVYSLACVAYELLSGHHPFGGRSAPLARAHGRQPQRVPGITGKQQQTLQRALLWTRGERRIDILELLAGLGCGDTTDRLGLPEEIAVAEASGSRWRRATVAFTLALILVGGGYFVWQYNLLPRNLANVLPITPPFADRELQSEAAVASGAADSSSVEEDVSEQTPPVAAIQPPAVAPLNSGQPAETAPAASKSKQSSAGTERSTAPATGAGQWASQTSRQTSRQASNQGVEIPSQRTSQTKQSAENSQTSAETSTKAQTKSAAQNEQAQKEDRAQATASAPGAAPASSSKPAVIEFDKDSYVTTEGEGYVRLLIRRTGSTRREVSFTWNLRSNSAEAGSDFAAVGPGVERIPAGAREVSVTIPLVQDSVKESTELFLVELQVDGEGVVLGERSSAAVIIVDDD